MFKKILLGTACCDGKLPNCPATLPKTFYHLPEGII
jgi:hypothetical protein